MSEEEHEEEAPLEPMTIVESAVLVTESAHSVAILDSTTTENDVEEADPTTPFSHSHSNETPADVANITDESE